MNIRSLLFLFLINALRLDAESSYLQNETTPALKYITSIEVSDCKSGMDPIDCVYVINLEARPEKWKRMQTLLKERGINANRVNAVNGWQLSDEIAKEVAGPYPVQVKGGPLGCLLSHFSIYKDAYDRGYKVIWILEDDADFIEDIRQIPTYLKVLSKVDPDWDIFYTDVDPKYGEAGYALYLVNKPMRPGQNMLPYQYYSLRLLACSGIFRILGRYGFTSMLISRSGLEKCVNYLSHTYVWAPIDCDLHFIPGIREYVPAKEIVTNLRPNGNSDSEPTSTLNPNNRSQSP